MMDQGVGCSTRGGKIGPARRSLLVLCFLSVFSLAMFAETPHGSTYVSLDSWVYPAFDRLAAMGGIRSQFSGLRPWTREMCAQLVLEARDRTIDADEHSSPEAQKIYVLLESEFREEIGILRGEPNAAAEVDSVYSRSTGISGTPWRDSYHFGQTIANDFGRPYGEGFNNVTGVSARVSRGRYFGAFRGELQHAPAFPGLSASLQQRLAALDRTAWSPYAQPVAETNRFGLLDSYAGVRLARWNLSFGKQSLWWGPGTTGAMLISNNIDPMYMLNLDRVDAFHLPGLLKYLGPARIQMNVAKMSGHHFPARPFFHAEKISFKPTENLEIGFSRSVVFLGEGHGFTFRRFWRSYFSVGDNPTQNLTGDPGDRKGGLDFSYRVPGLRRWLTIYTDSFVDDDPSPLAAPHRAAYNPGIYMPQLPGLPRVDFRLEAATTDVPRQSRGGRFFFWNLNYRDSYTNKGLLLGNTVGREGKAIDAASTYWLSARDRVQVAWRHGKVSSNFIPSGGTQNTFRVSAEFLARSNTEVKVDVRHERWMFPFLAPDVQSDTSASVQISISPGWKWKAGRRKQ